jgi:hypothetical protein
MCHRSVVLCSLSFVACLASASAASAAHPQERHGFWISFGGGVGSAQISCDDCPSDRETDAVGHVALGGTINKHVLLGGETNLWRKEGESGEALNFYNGLATLTVYPKAASGFFLKGGVGFSFVDYELREGSTTVTLDFGNGLGLVAGAGYDVRVGRNISITPAVSFWYGTHGDIAVFDEPLFANWKHNVVDFTVNVTFH